MNTQRIFAAFPIAVFALCAPAVSGQGIGGNSQQAPPPVKVEAPKAPQNSAEAGLGQAVDSRTYVIGPEDILMITVWREPDFTKPVIVRPDGKISMPLINDVQAAGLTPQTLAGKLTEALSEFINKPEISVSVNQIHSQKYFISGNVNRTGQFPLAVPTRIAEALSAAGGFRDFANTKKIVVMRGDKRLIFNWNDYKKGKHLEQNVFLQNGDTILVD
jgi:polysaccharide export outer membrane protein